MSKSELSELYHRLLSESHPGHAIRISKADLPLDIASLEVVFTTPNNTFRWRELPDAWDLWLEGPP
jgi:hypothetical protein